jgi:speckle-type POZ protein
MLSRTSAIAATTLPVSHDLMITGYSATKNNYTYIRSEKFLAGGRRWYLRYYPNSPSGCVTFLLYHDRDIGADEDKVEVSYQVSLLGPNGSPVPGYKTDFIRLTYGEPSIYQKGLIDSKTLERSGYLKDDAFSVRCEFSAPVTVTKTVVVPPTEEPPPTHTRRRVRASCPLRLRGPDGRGPRGRRRNLPGAHALPRRSVAGVRPVFRRAHAGEHRLRCSRPCSTSSTGATCSYHLSTTT